MGGKSSAVGWGPYETCREEGAIIATSHEHSYSRTKTLVSTEQQTVDPDWPDPNDVRVVPGATFVFVSGLDGSSIRDQERCAPTTYPYGCNGEWASIYTSDQGAKFGALFIEFHVDGDPGKARGYFKNVDGQIIDEFTIWGTGVPQDPNSVPTVGGVLVPDADEGETTTLAATFSDVDTDDTHTASIDWGDGTPAEAGTVTESGGSGSVAATHTYAQNGSYTVGLRVSDDDGGVSNLVTAAVTVDDVDPVADFSFSPSGPVVGSEVSFTDASTSSDAITWEWDFDTSTDSDSDGTPDNDVNSTLSNPSHTYAVTGTFTVRLTVSETDGDVATVEKQVTVIEPSMAPIVDGGPDQIADEGKTTTLAATFTDVDNGDTHTASIDWGDATPAEAGTVNESDGSVAATHAYADDGIYTVTVTVSDDGGGVGEGSYTVTAKNVVPTATAGGPYSGIEGSTISFTGSATDPGADVLTFEWDFDYHPLTFDVDGTGATPQHLYTESGFYKVALRVTDDDGGVSAVETADVTVNDVDPVADFSYSPAAPNVGEPVLFTDASTSYDGISWEWDFDTSSGSVVNSTEQNQSYTYDVAGTYTVRLTVSEADGDVSVVETQVVVVEPSVTSTLLYFSLSSGTSIGGLSVANEDYHRLRRNGFQPLLRRLRCRPREPPNGRLGHHQQ